MADILFESLYENDIYENVQKEVFLDKSTLDRDIKDAEKGLTGAIDSINTPNKPNIIYSTQGDSEGDDDSHSNTSDSDSTDSDDDSEDDVPEMSNAPNDKGQLGDRIATFNINTSIMDNEDTKSDRTDDTLLIFNEVLKIDNNKPIEIEDDNEKMMTETVNDSETIEKNNESNESTDSNKLTAKKRKMVDDQNKKIDTVKKPKINKKPKKLEVTKPEVVKQKKRVKKSRKIEKSVSKPKTKTTKPKPKNKNHGSGVKNMNKYIDNIDYAVEAGINEVFKDFPKNPFIASVPYLILTPEIRYCLITTNFGASKKRATMNRIISDFKEESGEDYDEYVNHLKKESVKWDALQVAFYIRKCKQFDSDVKDRVCRLCTARVHLPNYMSFKNHLSSHHGTWYRDEYKNDFDRYKIESYFHRIYLNVLKATLTYITLIPRKLYMVGHVFHYEDFKEEDSLIIKYAPRQRATPKVKITTPLPITETAPYVVGQNLPFKEGSEKEKLIDVIIKVQLSIKGFVNDPRVLKMLDAKNRAKLNKKGIDADIPEELIERKQLERFDVEFLNILYDTLRVFYSWIADGSFTERSFKDYLIEYDGGVLVTAEDCKKRKINRNYEAGKSLESTSVGALFLHRNQGVAKLDNYTSQLRSWVMWKVKRQCKTFFFVYKYINLFAKDIGTFINFMENMTEYLASMEDDTRSNRMMTNECKIFILKYSSKVVDFKYYFDESFFQEEAQCLLELISRVYSGSRGIANMNNDKKVGKIHALSNVMFDQCLTGNDVSFDHVTSWPSNCKFLPKANAVAKSIFKSQMNNIPEEARPKTLFDVAGGLNAKCKFISQFYNDIQGSGSFYSFSKNLILTYQMSFMKQIESALLKDIENGRTNQIIDFTDFMINHYKPNDVPYPAFILAFIERLGNM